MDRHVCPWWGGYFIDNRLRRWVHNPERILSPHVRPGMTVIDFGCGMGLFAIAAARLVGDRGQVIAIDLQHKMLNVLRKRARREHVAQRIRTHRCEVDSIAFDGAAAADFALAFYSVHEVPDPGRLFGEIRACLRPGGRMLLVEPIRHVPETGFETFVTLAGTSGLEVEERPHIRLSRAVVLRRPEV